MNNGKESANIIVRKLESKTIIRKAGEYMLGKIKAKNQLTIPTEIMKELKLNIGDDVNIDIIDNRIVISPVVLVDKEFWDEKLASEVKEEYQHYLKNKNEYKTYSNTEDLFNDLDKEDK
ncbi:AbrB/MazE/SpoVT family DNA-binding domain-containing protein [Brassicibacter mesophilus]|uniref:AbrB/MazE/SpoVT family DNA-binding domain-containing protein n=1 Tax=Brassicibacter mesophilus TaxID=745119 RepID=UPI003D1DAEC0